MNIDSVELKNNHIGMSFARIPAGSFLMGSNESEDSLRKDFPQYDSARLSAFDDESPLHKVIISKPFLMGRYPVTVGQFELFLVNSGYMPESIRDGTGGYGFNPLDVNTKTINDEVFEGRNSRYAWDKTGFTQEDDFPVVNITWNDANAMAGWLSEKEGKRYRLPTEAEWEYACRARTSSRYFTGDNPSSLFSHAKVFDLDTARIWSQWQQYALDHYSHYEFAAPVGRFLPNPFGLYDMIGNVWEWCSDWYAENYYQESPTIDPQGPKDGEAKVRRGGSWHTWPLYCRSSFRNVNTPDSRYILQGMRLVLEE
ncbi:formylglycine-generating enzyme family protein [Polynucleobacter sp. MG-28-Ekke-A2]|uniref:formylglycine-generating enzyme family protein n=1 Tax=Polynucleobacter sp. MG-28-Ekke-A2 TaxID=3108276 RepID=UPI002B2367B7|nr:formylglycine-generating enzyme family protein [Polynucleobacter sp. MG-28-Ekke-A2]MEA9602489.1 formylglycine-generating enzyme family protein [Polynucleobacter sp. MG-28-Ekke-A2]